jgi:hypothetical protein
VGDVLDRGGVNLATLVSEILIVYVQPVDSNLTALLALRVQQTVGGGRPRGSPTSSRDGLDTRRPTGYLTLHSGLA